MVFHALADKTRRGIVNTLSGGSTSAAVLARPHAMSLPAISKHLKILERANLVRRTVEGRTHRFTLNSAQLNPATEWIKEQQIFWEHRLGNLERFLNPEPGESDA